VPAPIILLPGLDGTGLIFRAFVAVAPARFAPRIVPLPQAGPMDYAALAERLAPDVERASSGRACVLLGESFAGPLALAIAARLPATVRAVVLAVTFVVPPAWRGFRPFVHQALFSLRPPGLGFRLVLAGRGASPELLADVQAARRAATSHAMAARLRAVLGVDAREALRTCPAPVLALHGRHDRLVPHRLSRAMAMARPDIEQVTFSGPHLLLQTKPGECWAAIEDFVARRTAL